MGTGDADDPFVLQMLNAATARIAVAWEHSFARRLWVGICALVGVSGSSLPGTQSQIEFVVLVASATALAMRRFATQPAPMTWILPAIGLFAGTATMVARRSRPRRSGVTRERSTTRGEPS